MPRAADVIACARSWKGTPYHDQASVKGAGCDCLGLLRGVWRELLGDEPWALPAYSRDWGEVGGRELLLDAGRRFCRPERPGDPRPGAILLFRMRAGAPAKHAGILVAPGAFVHARERLGVIEEAFSDPWRRRLVAAFRFPPVKGGR